MNPILLVAETGSDLTPELAAEYGVTLVPMHVSFGGQTRDDGAFPVSEMFEHYAKTRDLPRTSGCTPHDFEVVFDRLQSEHPGAPILHLAYSASTTCSMQSAIIAAEGRESIVSLDTKNVTAGQAGIVIALARYLRAHPESTLEQAVDKAHSLIARMHMGFFPGDLDYLRAGGRVSNAAYLGAKLLSLHPLIEILDGKLLSTKKYRGAMSKVVAKMADEYTEPLDRSEPLYLIYGEGLEERIMREVERIVTQKGFTDYTWVKTGCVIAAHSGPGSFGVAGFGK
ncbi:MAG: DegV family protein [Candidatus Ventricola sp.]